MRLLSVTIRGLRKRYQGAEPVHIDFDALGDGLVAFVGATGEGKTTAMEAALGSIHKSFPSRPKFYENFIGSDAFIESVWDDDGEEVKVRMQVNADRSTCERYMFVDGKSITDGKAASFEAEVLKRFGSRELMLASVFSAQNRAGNFLDMTKGGRKDLFGELLGLGHLEGLAEQARDRATAARGRLEAKRSECAAIEQELGVQTLQLDAEFPVPRAIEAAQNDIERAAAAVDAAAGQLDAARSEESAATAALERAKTAGERIAGLVREEQAARTALVDAGKTLKTAEDEPAKITARYDERIKDLDARKVEDLAAAAEKRAKERRQAIADRKVEELAATAQKKHDDARAAIEKRRADYQAEIDRAPALEEAKGKLAGLIADREQLEAKIAELKELSTQEREARAKNIAAKTASDRATKAHEQRLGYLRGTVGRLGQVPCTEKPLWAGINREEPVDLAAACPLLADAHEAKGNLAELEAEGPPTEIEEARVSAAAYQEVLDRIKAEAKPDLDVKLATLKTDEATARNDVVRAQAVDTMRRRIAALATEISTADATLAEEMKAAETARHQAAAALLLIAADLSAELHQAAAAVEAVGIEKERAAAKRDEDQGNAATALDEAREREASAKQTHADATKALEDARTDVVDVETAQANLDKAKASREEWEQGTRATDRVLATARARLDTLRGREKVLEAVRTELQLAERELGDWARLDADLGKNGIQALEIDAAGPEVSRIANENLAMYERRSLTIAFETLRAKKSAPGEYAEDFGIRVFDRGEEQAVESLSGGEKVLVGEAIGNALSVYNAKRNPVRFETAWRDETAGALDPESRHAYVPMLRNFMQQAGLKQIQFIAHDRDVWEAADAQLYVEGGRISPTRLKAAA